MDTVKLTTKESTIAYIVAAYGLSDKNPTPRTLVAHCPSYIQQFLTEAIISQGLEDSIWMLREATRIATTEYLPIRFQAKNSTDRSLSVLINLYPEHFIHRSKTNPAMISYTPDKVYGKQDRRVVTTIGRYIKKYFPDTTDQAVRKYSDTYRYYFGVDDILWAITGDQLEKVYTSGPGSCMTNDMADPKWAFSIHPARVYEAPGLKVAYLQRDGKINARSVVYENGEDKRYVRVYGDELLILKLENSGYKQGNLEGVFVKYIPVTKLNGTVLPRTVVMPYLDDMVSRSAQSIEIIDETVRIVRHSQANAGKQICFPASNTYGIAGLNATYHKAKDKTHCILTPIDAADPSKTVSTILEEHTCGHCGVIRQTRHESLLEGYHICEDCLPYYEWAVFNLEGHSTWVLRSQCRHMPEDGLFILDDPAVLQANGYVETTHPDHVWIRSRDMIYTSSGLQVHHSYARTDSYLGSWYGYHEVIMSSHGYVLPLIDLLYIDRIIYFEDGSITKLPSTNAIPLCEATRDKAYNEPASFTEALFSAYEALKKRSTTCP